MTRWRRTRADHGRAGTDGVAPTEHAAGHVPGSEQLSAGRLLWHLDALPAEGTVVTYCQSGVRNRVVASALRRAGGDVVELEGSYLGWQAWKRRQQQG